MTTRDPMLHAALDDLRALRRDVIEDQLTFTRRCRQLEALLADVVVIRTALNYCFVEERPA